MDYSLAGAVVVVAIAAVLIVAFYNVVILRLVLPCAEYIKKFLKKTKLTV